MDEEYVIAAVVAEEREYGEGEGENIYLKRLRDESNPFDRSERKFRKLFRLSRAMGRHVVDTLCEGDALRAGTDPIFKGSKCTELFCSWQLPDGCVTFIIAAFGYSGPLTDVKQSTIRPTNNNNNETNDQNKDFVNPENTTESYDLAKPAAEITPENDTESGSMESYEYVEYAENATEYNDPNTGVTPNEKDSEDQYPEIKREAVYETEKERKARRRKRKGFVSHCLYKKHVKIEDEFGCELCTCIYEKSMMLCSPYTCQKHGPGPLAELLDENSYNDDFLGVQTHFSEYSCERGDVVQSNFHCECTCVQDNILSCPPDCKLGRPLN